MSDLLTNQDIICISSIDWNFLWQGQQEIMSRLAERGNRVLYVENTGVRRPRRGDMQRIKERLRNWWRNYAGVRQESENLYIFSPLVLPFPYSHVARWINLFFMGRALRRWMKSFGFAQPIIWTFLPTPLALGLARRLDGKLLVYHRSDDFRSSSPQARRIVPHEVAMLRQADLVITNSRQLELDSLKYNPHTYHHSYGVNLDHFNIEREPEDVPAELAALPRPYIGYVGGIHQHVDFALLTEVAEREPRYSFIFVGPQQVDPGRLATLPNVHFLGERPHAELARYLAAFDAALIPYARNAYTACVFPAKLPEYFAFGLPVVSSSLPEVSAFRDRHGQLLSMADTAAEFRDAIDHELVNDSPQQRQRRRDVAAEYSWPERIDTLCALLSGRLDQLSHERAKAWQLRMRQVVRRTYTRAAQVVMTALVLYLLIFQSPLMWWLAAPLSVAEAPRASDAIVVLAGGIGETGQPGSGTFERTRHAARFYQQGLGKAIVLVSGFHYIGNEARDMRIFLASLGIPDRSIMVEERGVNTLEYAQNVGKLMEAQGWTSALVISTPYHMRRAILTFRRQTPEARFTPTPVPKSTFYDHGRGISRTQLGALGHEALGILYYWWRGYL